MIMSFMWLNPAKLILSLVSNTKIMSSGTSTGHARKCVLTTWPRDQCKCHYVLRVGPSPTPTAAVALHSAQLLGPFAF